jgi:hypothetical protein
MVNARSETAADPHRRAAERISIVTICTTLNGEVVSQARLYDVLTRFLFRRSGGGEGVRGCRGVVRRLGHAMQGQFLKGGGCAADGRDRASGRRAGKGVLEPGNIP